MEDAGPATAAAAAAAARDSDESSPEPEISKAPVADEKKKTTIEASSSSSSVCSLDPLLHPSTALDTVKLKRWVQQRTAFRHACRLD